MGRKNNRVNYMGDMFWQSSAYNQRAYAKNLSLLVALAINRFRWTGLPETCDARFLEWALHRYGLATMCHPESMPDVWQTLTASPNGGFDVYGYPTKWRATGFGDATNYDVTKDNGELCYYSYSSMNLYSAGAANLWNALEMFARKLTHYDRTEDVNLFHQQKPYVMVAPQSQQQQLVNLFKQVAGGEPAILGDKGLADLANNITKIDTDVPLITEDLARSKLNVFSECLTFLGIPRLAFEKGERMIEEEVRATTAPATLMLLDCMQARRDFCEKMRRFGFDLQVYFNDDWESYNFNYINNIEAQAQDGLIGGEQNAE